MNEETMDKVRKRLSRKLKKKNTKASQEKDYEL